MHITGKENIERDKKAYMLLLTNFEFQRDLDEGNLTDDDFKFIDKEIVKCEDRIHACTFVLNHKY